MKYPYYVEYTEGGTPIIRLPEGLGLVTIFLFDIPEPLGRTYFLKEIERVLQGEIPYSEVSTEICGLEIRPDFTTLTDIIVDPDDGGPQERCVIETEALRDLLLVRLALKWKERMKYRYQIEFTALGSPVMRFPSTKELEGVTRFFFGEMVDAQSSDFCLKQIDRVLRGEVPTIEVRGQVYLLRIKNDFTTVIDTLAESKKASKKSCVIETEELKKLLVIWLELKMHLAEQARVQAITAPERTTDPEIAVLPTLPAHTLIYR